MKFSAVSMKRGGQHAIINWIALNAGGEFLHFNCCHIVKNNIVPTCRSWVIYYDKLGNKVNYLKKQKYNKTLKRHKGVNNFIYNFEDYCVDILSHKLVEDTIKIIILRDAFNMTASSIRHANNLTAVEQKYFITNMHKRLDIWLDHASNFTKNNGDFVCVNYNKWTHNNEYRDNVATLLGFDNSDVGIFEVGDFGGGSSFDGLNKDGNEVDVLNRYTYLVKDNYLDRLLQYHRIDELDQMNKEIFGISLADVS